MRQLRFPKPTGLRADDTSLLDALVEADARAEAAAQTLEDGEVVLHVPDDVQLDEGKLATVVAAFDPRAGRRRAALRELRRERNARLAASDWTQLADVPAETRAAWQPYRQELRDLPATVTNPDTVTWPEPPGPVEQGTGP